MTAYEIPPDLRPWCETTAPKMTTKGWRQAKRLAAMTRGLVFVGGLYDEISVYQARALLAYADEVAAGLNLLGTMTARAFQYAVEGDRAKARDARAWAAGAADTLVTAGGDLTEHYGRYIAGCAKALRGAR